MKTEAQKRATAKYESKAYSKILLRLRNDTEPTRDTIAAAAAAAGESVNEYIITSIRERMEKGKDPDGLPELIREKFID